MDKRLFLQIVIVIMTAFTLIFVGHYAKKILENEIGEPSSFLKNEAKSCKEASGWSHIDMDKIFTMEYIKSVDKLENEMKIKGHSRENNIRYYHKVGLQVLWVLANQSKVNTICEIGLNMGHSTLVWLHANPKAHVYMFDIGSNTGAAQYAEYFEEKYPERFNITWGDSIVSLPEFIEENPNVVCDFMIVEGGLSFYKALTDLKNFNQMANKVNNRVMVNNFEKGWIQNAWRTATEQKLVKEHIRCNYKQTSGFDLAIGEFAYLGNDTKLQDKNDTLFTARP